MSSNGSANMGAFAQREMARHGWKSGQGLGKDNAGMKQALKVKRKQDTDGLGRQGDQFDFAWWDHVYNRAASNIVVAKDESDEEAVVCKPLERLKREEIITTKRPEADDPPPVALRGTVPATPLYSHFVSSAKEADVPKAKKDYSMKLSDEQLLEICEGRRLGQRGSYEQNGKEKRLRKLDAEVGKKRKRKQPTAVAESDDVPAE